MRLTLVTAAALVVATFAAVVKDQSEVGPLSPEKDPRTSLEESIRKMRLSIDRELVYLARMDEVKRSMNTEGMVARQVYPADEETESTFHGFTDKVNDGIGLFRPIRPGVNVPSARQFGDEPEPSDVPIDPGFTAPPIDPTVTIPPIEPGVTIDPIDGGNGDRGIGGDGGDDGPTVSEVPLTPGRPGRPNRPNRPNRPGRPNRPNRPGRPVESPDVMESEAPLPFGSPVPLPPTPIFVPTDEPSPIDPVETLEPSADPGAVLPPGAPVPLPVDPSDPTPEATPTLPLPGAIGEEPTVEPTPESIDGTAQPTPEDDDDDVCFPADATVELEDGSSKKMSEVQLGDRVLVASGEYSEVFMFTHKMSSIRHNFIELVTASGHNLALTKGHYLYVNDKLAAASTVRKGDILSLGNNIVTTVQDVKSIISTGLYNPQTVHGDIIVNGVRASTYTLSVEPKVAHALLAPLRAVYDRIGFSLSAFDMGADYLASLVPSGSLVN